MRIKMIFIFSFAKVLIKCKTNSSKLNKLRKIVVNNLIHLVYRRSVCNILLYGIL